jgi:ATP-dependent Lon protease
VGGELLQTEVTIMPGKGKLIITGKLGEVMQESAQAALSYVRSRARQFDIDANFYETKDIHIHVPEGATPKDGPSAGITMATSLVSALAGVPVRHDVAMTGEITLRGRVLPIGGLKEKILAAHRGKVHTVIIPEENEKELRDVPAAIRKAMVFHTVAHMDDVLRIALKLEHPEKFFGNKESEDKKPDEKLSSVTSDKIPAKPEQLPPVPSTVN